MTHPDTPTLNTPTTGYENRRIIGGKTYHVLHQELEINASVDAVWDEVAGNFVNSVEIAESVIDSRCLSGDLKKGLGTERLLHFKFDGKEVEAKERIVDYRDAGDIREFTYDVYASKGSPLTVKVYNTWTVRKNGDGKTMLGTAFTFRAKLAFMNSIIGKQLARSGSLRTGLLAYKHYLETGEKRVEAAKLNSLYSL